MESEMTRQRVLKTITGKAFRSSMAISSSSVGKSDAKRVENQQENQVQNQLENQLDNQQEDYLENQLQNQIDIQVDVQESADDSGMLTETSEDEYEYDIF